jgi:cytochrome c553
MADPHIERSTSDESPAGALAEQRALDRPWRNWASLIIAAAVVLAALLGFVIVPAAQRENAGLSFYEAVCRSLGLRAGSPAQRQPVNRAVSLPVSQVSWSPEIMEILSSGDTRRGAQLAAQVCASCHGDKGLSQTDIPALAGQTPYAIYKQLSDYRSGARVHPQMTPVARQLSESDLAATAAYFAAASREYAAIGARDLVSEVEIERLAKEGDSRRRIPACLSCHLNGVGGPIETPVIIGQDRDYLLAQLNAYADGSRRNDVYGRMRDISAKLTPEERELLARYFQGTM